MRTTDAWVGEREDREQELLRLLMLFSASAFDGEPDGVDPAVGDVRESQLDV